MEWDIFMSLILLLSCVITPLEIAFGGSIHDDINKLLAVDYITDVFFFIDIIVIFNTAYMTSNFYLIDDRKQIALTYLKSWFIIDLISCSPVDLFFKAHISANTETASITVKEFARFSKMYKLVKLIKMFRVMKIVKD